MGEIVIDADLNTTGFQQGSRELEAAIKSMLKTADSIGKNMTSAAKGYGSALQGASGNTKRFDSTLEDTKTKLGGLMQKLVEFGNTQFSTKEYEKLQAQFEENDKTLGKLLEKRDKMDALGVSKEDAKWKTVQYDIKKAYEEADRLSALLQDMENRKDSFVFGSESDAFNDLYAKIQTMRDQYTSLVDAKNQALSGNVGVGLSNSLSNVAASAARATASLARMAGSAALTFLRKIAINAKNAAIQLMRMVGNAISNGLRKIAIGAKNAAVNLAKMAGSAVKNGFKKIASLAANATRSLLNLGRSAKESGNGFNFSLKNLLKYGLGIRSMFVLTNRLRGAITDSFGSLVKQFPSVNKSISGMVTALNTLKNSFGAAFAPIITAVAPYITSFLNMLANAMTQVSRFFAVLTGQKFYYKAKTVQVDYAQSLNNTTHAQHNATQAAQEAAEAIEEENRQLASFDDLNILAAGSAGAGGGGGSDGGAGGVAAAADAATEAFEKVPIDSTLDGLDKIMEKIRGIFNVFKQAWAENGQATIDAAKAAFQSLVNVASTVANTIYEVFTSGVGLAWVNSWLIRIQSLFNVVKALADTFVEAWNDNNNGYNYVTSIFNVFTQINLLIAEIRNSFANAWSSGVGESIWDHILSIATKVNDTIANIAQNFRLAWEDNGRGTRIWTDILKIIDDVLDAVDGIATSMADWAANLDFGPALNAFDRLLQAINPVVDAIMNGLKWAFTDVLEPLGKWTIEVGLPTLMETLAGAFEVMSSAIEKLKEPAKDVWNNFFKPLGAWVATNVITNLEDLKRAFNEAAQAIDSSDLKDLPDILAKLAGTVGQKIAEMFNTGITAIKESVAKIPWGEIATLLANGINGFILGIDWNNIGELLGRLFGDVLGAFLTLVKKIKWDEIGAQLADGIREMISERNVHWDKRGVELGEAFNKVVDGLKAFIKKFPAEELGGSIGTFLHNAIAAVEWANLAETVWTFFTQAVKAGGSFVEALLFGVDEKTARKRADGSAYWSAYVDGLQDKSLATRIGEKLGDLINAGIKAMPAEKIGEVFNDVLIAGLDLADEFVKTFDPDEFREKLEVALARVEWGRVVRSTWLLIKDSLYNILKSIPIIGDGIAAIEEELSASDMADKLTEAMGKGMRNLASVFDAYGLEGGRTMGDKFFHAFNVAIMNPDGTIIQSIKDKLHEFFTPAQIEALEQGKLSIREFYNGLGFGGIDEKGNVTQALSDLMDEIFMTPFAQAGLAGSGVAEAFSTEFITNTMAFEARGANVLEDTFDIIWGKVQGEENGEIAAQGYCDAFIKYVTDESGNVKDEFSTLVEAMFGTTDLESLGKLDGKDFLIGLINGVQNTSGETSTKLVDTINTILEKVRTSPEGLHESSPSKRSEQWGKDFVEGFTQGVEKQESDSKTRTSTVFDNIAKALETAKTGVKNFFSNLFGGGQKEETTNTVTADSIAKPYEEAAPRIQTATTNIQTYATGMVAAVTASFATLGTAMGTNVTVATQGVTLAFTTMQNTVSASVVIMQTTVTAQVALMATSVKTQFAAIQTAVTTHVTAAKTSAQTNFTTMKVNLTNNVNSIKTAVTSGFTSVKNAITTNATAAKTSAQSNFSLIKTNITTSVDTIKKKVTEGFAAVKKNITDNLTAAQNTAKNISWVEVGMAITNGIQAGLYNGWTWLQNTVWDLATSLYNTACSALGIASPSKLFRDGVGEMISLGIAEGVEGSEGTVINTIDNLTNDMVKRMSNLEAISANVTLRTPNVALGGLTPYSVSGKLEGDSTGLAAALAASNDDLSSVIIQSVNNATIAVVRAIQQYSTTNINLDQRSLTDAIIEEINRRTRAAGSSPLLI